jgi:hypothetical protein
MVSGVGVADVTGFPCFPWRMPIEAADEAKTEDIEGEGIRT